MALDVTKITGTGTAGTGAAQRTEEPSSSSPTFVIKKKSGKGRALWGLRAINKATQPFPSCAPSLFELLAFLWPVLAALSLVTCPKSR